MKRTRREKGEVQGVNFELTRPVYLLFKEKVAREDTTMSTVIRKMVIKYVEGK